MSCKFDSCTEHHIYLFLIMIKIIFENDKWKQFWLSYKIGNPIIESNFDESMDRLVKWMKLTLINEWFKFK